MSNINWRGILLPAIVAQSIGIAGGFTTGREVMEYAGQFGANGIYTVAILVIGLGLVGAVAYEFARIFHTYDYKNFMSGLIWKGWPLFDLLYIVMATVVLAVVASATGNILQDVWGIPYTPAVAAVIAITGVVIYLGRHWIERFKEYGTTALYIGYLLFAVVALMYAPDNVASVFANWDTSAAEGGTMAAIESGFVYAGIWLIVFPAVLFTLDYLETQREALLAGFTTGVMVGIPFLLTYLAMMAYYPAEGVVEAPVPWLEMLQRADATWVVGYYGLVVGWTLVESAVGFSHAIIDRVDEDIREIDYGFFDDWDGLSSVQKAGLAVAFLLAALLLSRVGIITLVGTYYTVMAYLFALLLVVPLFTVGLYRIANPDWRASFWGEDTIRPDRGAD